MNYLQISIPVTDAEIKDILIARLGSDMGYEGFEEEEGRLQAFVPEDRFNEEILGILLSAWSLNFEKTRLPEKNWNEEWERNFEPVIVEGWCGIRAFFHPPATGVEFDLVITPKMSFGTGHHATTWMMLAAMRDLDLTGRNVLDFGTGTGVLAILAEKLGASDVLAIDNDDWSIGNARENVSVNGCNRISVEKMEIIPDKKLFSIILSNINKNIILSRFDALEQQLAPDGVILLSGLLREDLDEIETAAAQKKLTISGRMTKNNWLCLKLQRTCEVIGDKLSELIIF
jgi:ribosomal protein L11 methyltransferase